MVRLIRCGLLTFGSLVLGCATSDASNDLRGATDAAAWAAEAARAVSSADGASAMGPEVGAVVTDAGAADIEASPPFEASSDAPGIAPPSIDGVVLWLDSSRDVAAEGGRVTRWGDQSAMHNDAAPPSAAVAPTLLSVMVNGQPVIHFDASRKTVLLVPDAASLHFGTADFTIEVVVGYRNKSKGGVPVDHLDGWGYVFNKMIGNRLGVGLMGNWPVSETASIGSQFGCETTEQGGSLLSKGNGYNDGVMRLWAMRRAGITVELRRGGAVDSSAKWNPPINVDAMGTPPVSIGARLYQGQTSASFPLDGDVAEIVVVKGTIAEPQLTLLESYLTTKYALH